MKLSKALKSDVKGTHNTTGDFLSVVMRKQFVTEFPMEHLTVPPDRIKILP